MKLITKNGDLKEIKSSTGYFTAAGVIFYNPSGEEKQKLLFGFLIIFHRLSQTTLEECKVLNLYYFLIALTSPRTLANNEIFKA